MNKNILLIEKEKLLKEFWEERLQDEGFSVVSVSPEENIFSKAKEPVPDFVFTGTGLEQSDIESLLKEMKKLNKDLMVISPTNSEELAKELNAIKLQGLSYKEHPIKIDQVRIAIRDALKIKELKERYNFKNLVGESAGIKEVFKTISQIMSSSATTVLILGETGAGKEEVAKAIHYNSDRVNRPFLTISCTTVPETLMESELFGHEQGAFTDARTAKKGLLELADGGTVFFDEIGDMKMGPQGKLLRFLEEKKFYRIGGTKDISVDVRIIAATNKNLEKLIENNEFRKDLYYRLKVFPIYIPPLRERKEDIPLLAKYFIGILNPELKKDIKGVTFLANQKFIDYPWPGNVRELKNVIERAMILCKGDFISPEELMLEEIVKEGEINELSLEENEKRIIKIALARADNNYTRASELLGITRFALRNRLKKYNML